MPDASLSEAVREVIEAVRARGDAAVCELTARWDGAALSPAELRVPHERIAAADVTTPFARAFARAAERIRAFHEAVKPRSVYVEDGAGVRMGMRWTPVHAVGLYIPGGKASYPSTLAMTAVPAQIAGVERIVVVSPPGPAGEVAPEVLLAARVLGLDEIYRVGGAQAVAALAIGTGTIPRVDKVFGPGNAYVAEAKKQLYGEVGIDMLAGPSELVVYADRTSEPEWVAADLMAQAEHDESTRVTLLAASASVLERVREELARLLADAPRREIIAASLERSGRFEVMPSAAAAARRIDEIAPEHLSLQVADPWDVLTLVHNAGAIFLGGQSPVAVGDYYAGPNHVLPTGGTARFASCLSVEDFMKRSNVVALREEFLRDHCGDVEVLAAGEKLPAHALSVALRRTPSWRRRLRRGLRRVTPYALVEEDAEVKLNQNESPWDVPEEIKDEVARRLREEPWNRYHQRVPQRFVDRLAARSGVAPSCVLVASGSNLLLQWIFEAFGGRDATVLLPEPSFSLYRLWGEIAGARLETYELDADLAYDADAICRAVAASSPALTVLCLPNNPTGTELEPGAVRRIARATATAGGALVIDEAYREFSAPALDRTLLLEEFEHLLLVRTFSKAFAAAGMRLGYALTSGVLAEELRKMVPPFHLNLFAAVLGEVLLERGDVFVERLARIAAEKARLMGSLRALPGVEVLPSAANFFLVRLAGAADRMKGLARRGVLVRGVGGHPLLEECLRVSVGAREENDRLVATLAELLRTPGGNSG